MNRLVLFLLLLFSFSVQAQDLLHCGADEMRIATLEANPKIAQAVIDRDAALEAFTRNYEQSPARDGQIYTIPMVFHVIHRYGDENISREQILDAIEAVNKTFRKTRADTAGIVADFKSIHADTEIEFALATKDPDGNCHSGINRIASSLTNSGDHRVKDLIHWDPSMYLNVYVVSNAAGLAGHCVWPADADTIPAWDGIVISYSYVGTIGTSDPIRSVAFAHECGHYLNLHHIWGGNNVPNFYYLPVGQASNCDEDDLVDDTPNTIGWSTCDLNASSCGNTVDNVQNAMDYTYCNIMFTKGQKTRMHAALNSPIAHRNNLWTEAKLIASGVTPQEGLCAADFEADKQVICSETENEVVFRHTSYNGTIDSLSWSFENGTPSTSTDASPTVVYTQPGKHDVSLTVYGQGQSRQVMKNDFITVLPDQSVPYPFWDWFESGTPLNTTSWTEHSLDTTNTWAITDVGYHSAGHSIMVDNWDNELLTVDELYSPVIDISNASQMRLSFKYAFGAKDVTTNATNLVLQVRKNCGSHWASRFALNGSGAETAPPQALPFEPQDELLWKQKNINIPTNYFSEDFQFRFIYTSGGSNRFFLDDINVDLTAGIEDQWPSASAISIYPNPTSEQLNVKFTLEEPSSIGFSIVDVLGKVLITVASNAFAAGVNQYGLNVKALESGVYFLQVESNGVRSTERFIIF